MAKTKSKAKRSSAASELDGVYLLKLLLYVLLGTLWIKVSATSSVQFSIPIGFIIGLAFACHEHFQIDRKIEFAVLLVAMLFGYFAPYGLYVQL